MTPTGESWLDLLPIEHFEAMLPLVEAEHPEAVEDLRAYIEERKRNEKTPKLDTR